MAGPRLIDLVQSSPRRLVAPLMGFPGTALTHSTIWRNEFNSKLQYRTLKSLVDRFEPDVIFFMMDLAVEAGAIGIPVIFPANGSPSVAAHLVKHVEDLEQFKAVELLYDGRVRTYLDIMRLMDVNFDIPKGAYVIGPFTLAGLMMGATEIALATIDNPDLVHAAAEFATQVIIRYAQALVDAGADLICILEPTATFISPRAFRKFSGAYVRRIIEKVNAIPVLHICGNTTHLIQAMAETGAQGLSLDAAVDLPAAAAKVPEDVVLVGNVDPVRVMVNASGEEVQTSVRTLLDAMAPYPNFILSTGCDLPPETPLENIEAFMAAGKEWKKAG